MSEFGNTVPVSIEEATEILNSLNWDDNTDFAADAKKFTWDIESDEEDDVEISSSADTELVSEAKTVVFENNASAVDANTVTVNSQIEVEDDSVAYVPELSMAYKRVDEISRQEVLTIENSNVSFNVSQGMLDQWKQQLDDFIAGKFSNSDKSASNVEGSC